MLKKALLLVTLAVFLVLAYLSNRAPKNTIVEENTPEVTVMPTPNVYELESWQEYKSPKFLYSFRYPKDWYLLPYDETNPSIIVGTHSLMNYDPDEVIKFMDHGIVDWNKFIGNRIVIKADITAANLDGKSVEEYIKENFGSASLQPTADLKFGDFETVRYDTKTNDNDRLIRTYITSFNEDKIFWANVTLMNRPDDAIIQDSPEWQQFVKVAESFRTVE